MRWYQKQSLTSVRRVRVVTAKAISIGPQIKPQNLGQFPLTIDTFKLRSLSMSGKSMITIRKK